MTCALFSATLLSIGIKVTGDNGTLNLFNPTGPQFGYRMTVKANGAKRRVKVDGAKTPTYVYQLAAFRDAVRDGKPVLTPPEDSIANMRVIDAIYEAAGLPVRGT
jgi:predicted dehydrogenase